MNKLICLGNGPVMSFTPYLAKLATSLSFLGVETTFITWARENDRTNAVDPENITTNILLLKGKENSSKLYLVYLYIIWMIRIFFYVLKSDNKYYFCSRFENSFPVWLASFFKNIEYVYADRDNLHSTYKWPLPIKKIIKVIEFTVAKKSTVHLVPGDSRNYTLLDNVIVIPNLPNKELLNKAKKIYLKRNKQIGPEKYVVYINGWLAQTRGLSNIENALLSNKLDDKIVFVIAGELNSKLLAKIKSKKNVIYLGRVSNEEALSYYFDSSVAISLYDPSIDINKSAEPNKWWDCVVTRTPFITNYGINTVGLFKPYVPFYQIEYFDSYSLVNLLFDLMDEKSTPPLLSDGQPEFPLWDERIENVLNKFLS
jgi:hypothetical protein